MRTDRDSARAFGKTESAAVAERGLGVHAIDIDVRLAVADEEDQEDQAADVGDECDQIVPPALAGIVKTADCGGDVRDDDLSSAIASRERRGKTRAVDSGCLLRPMDFRSGRGGGRGAIL